MKLFYIRYYLNKQHFLNYQRRTEEASRWGETLNFMDLFAFQFPLQKTPHLHNALVDNNIIFRIFRRTGVHKTGPSSSPFHTLYQAGNLNTFCLSEGMAKSSQTSRS